MQAYTKSRMEIVENRVNMCTLYILIILQSVIYYTTFNCQQKPIIHSYNTESFTADLLFNLLLCVYIIIFECLRIYTKLSLGYKLQYLRNYTRSNIDLDYIYFNMYNYKNSRLYLKNNIFIGKHCILIFVNIINIYIYV